MNDVVNVAVHAYRTSLVLGRVLGREERDSGLDVRELRFSSFPWLWSSARNKASASLSSQRTCTCANTSTEPSSHVLPSPSTFWSSSELMPAHTWGDKLCLCEYRRHLCARLPTVICVCARKQLSQANHTPTAPQNKSCATQKNDIVDSRTMQPGAPLQALQALQSRFDAHRAQAPPVWSIAKRPPLMAPTTNISNVFLS